MQERLKGVLRDVEKVKDVILFCDEMHTMVGAGATGGSMDASNMLKPALARGTLHFVGATTLNEYRRHVEKDGALARRFQPVYVREPSIEDTISILRGLKHKYELHHRVHITDGAIVSAALMSQRYLTERKLPDKAVDLVDEVGPNPHPRAAACALRPVLVPFADVCAAVWWLPPSLPPLHNCRPLRVCACSRRASPTTCTRWSGRC